MTSLALTATFWITLIAGVPISIGIGLVALLWLYLVQGPGAFVLLPQRIFSGMDSFPLLAIPLFVFAGELMLASGITGRLVRLASALVGHISGGLSYVNVVSNMVMAGISGSSAADATTLGSVLIPAMKRSGYDSDYAAALTAAAAVIGSVIPPSIAMIIYAYVMGGSVAALFLAGVVPGVLMGLALCLVCYLIARVRGYGERTERVNLWQLWLAFRSSLPALMMPLIIVGGILSGAFTPTEAGAVAVAYALGFLIIERGGRALGEVPQMLVNAAILSAVVYWLLGTSNVLGWIMAAEGVPAQIAQVLTRLTPEPWSLLLLLNILLLLVGMITEPPTAIILLAPILQPVAASLGVDPLHFGIIFVINCVIGLATPPVGTTIFIACILSGDPIEKVGHTIIPFICAEFVVLLLVTYVPYVALALPRAFGL